MKVFLLFLPPNGLSYSLGKHCSNNSRFFGGIMDATEQFKTAIDLLTQAFNKNNQELVDSYIEVAKKAQKNGYLDMAVEYYARGGAAISAHAESMLPST